MVVHELDGLINSTRGHGRTAPCACELPRDPPADMPPKCQAVLLKDEWATSWHTMKRDAKGARKSRFELYQLWARKMRIDRIRVQPPQCVRDVIAKDFGASSTGFVVIPNPCTCETCDQERAREEMEAEAANEASSDDASASAST